MLRLDSFPLKKSLVSACLLASLAAAGCVVNDGPTGSIEPARAIDLTFDCGDGENLNLAGDGTTLLVTDSQDTRIRLEASPPDQRSRYDADGHALVLNEGEALWMKAGSPPMTCRR